MRTRFVAILALAALVSLAPVEGRDPIEWRWWGGDAEQTKYSTADEITPANVRNLKIAWQWRTIDRPQPSGLRPGSFQITPLMIDNVVYLSTSYSQVAALDAETGAQLWAFDPNLYQDGAATGGISRGVAYWRRGNDQRIFVAGRQQLYAVDAKTGTAVRSFGKGGVVTVTDGLVRPIKPNESSQNSPPVVYENLVIIGSSISDRIQYKGDPPGTVQAFDARTGERVWVFYTIPQSAKDAGADTWENESWRQMGHANVWAPMTLDEARGLLYLPTTTPTGDYWGGDRLGANLFAESLVCLDVRTGKRKWYFQGVHHGVWDYDFPAAPSLGTVTVDGRRIDIVAQVSKQGFTYVFDRVTGKPVWPIEERPVDTTTDVPGERLQPTQPFPTKPPALVQQGVSMADANDLTPEIKSLAEEQLARFRLGPLFTPPSLRGTVQMPSQAGGANWGGAAFDPETGMLYVKALNTYHVSVVCKNDGKDPLVQMQYGNYCGEDNELFRRNRTSSEPVQTPPGHIGLGITYSDGKLAGIPLTKPPYAYLVAVDLTRGVIAWRVPFGEGSQALRSHPLLKGVTLPDRIGTLTYGPSVMVTKAGLLFVGGGDPYLYAYDKATGKELSRVATPYRTTANPITYRARSGRRFVVIATGSGPDATLVAFSLHGTGVAAPAAAQGPVGRVPDNDGRTAYTRVCQGCHGAEGAGAVGPRLVPLTREDAAVRAIVREGMGQMPPISAGELTDTEAGHVIQYLREAARRR